METLRREIPSDVRIEDSRRGICTYTASTADLDSYREVIRADGWRFDHFKKNAPFCDSHDYSSLEKLVGKVIEFKVRGGKLIETVQWANDVQENKLAQLGWRMTEAGYLKAVSVGFYPVRVVRPGDSDWSNQLKELGFPKDARVNCIYTEQQQIELSVCIVGANPNALANARSAGVLSHKEFDFLRTHRSAPSLAGECRAVRELRACFARSKRRTDNAVNEMLRAIRSQI